jgi:iron complex transport system substrate-binding protein
MTYENGMLHFATPRFSNMLKLRHIHFTLTVLLAAACAVRQPAGESAMEYARWFSLSGDTLTVISPYDGSRDTTVLHACRSLVCMSSSHVGYLEAIGADSLVSAVSGVNFLADSAVRCRAVEIGYDSSPDYETIVRLQPDYVLLYAISSAPTQALLKLKDLGIPVIVLHEHLEPHPLGRAEYVKLFGQLAGCPEKADSVYSEVRNNYLALTMSSEIILSQALASTGSSPAKVLLNIPYGDQWYIPGSDNYLYRLISDAGGTILGATEGVQSSVISVEKAYELSREADFWLHPGWCTTKAELAGVHPLFAHFPVLQKPVWNNTAQATPGGGNAFWETGPARPDLILQDLVSIFTASPTDSLTYYIPVE